MIKLVIFDLDGVLTETSTQHYQAWRDIFAEMGYSLDGSYLDKVRGISRLAALELIMAELGISQNYSQQQKQELATKKNQRYQTLIAEFGPDKLFEGVKPLFAQLHNRQIKTALASVSKNAPTLIERLGIKDDLDYVVDPHSVTKGKPDPEIFQRACQYFGFEPSQCIGVEDAKAGVEAIKAAGMYAIGIGDKQLAELADCFYEKVADIDMETILDQINKSK